MMSGAAQHNVIIACHNVIHKLFSVIFFNIVWYFAWAASTMLYLCDDVDMNILIYSGVGQGTKKWM